MRIVRYGIAAAAALSFTSAWAGDASQAAQDECTAAVEQMHWSDAKPAQAGGASGTAEAAGAGGDVAKDVGKDEAKHRTVAIEAPDQEHIDASALSTSP